jgi:type IV pilus biogenesis protein CpaD/CtpE
MNRKLILITILSALAIGCASTSDSNTTAKTSKTNTAAATSTGAKSDKTFHILMDIPYAKGASVATNVKDECTALGTKLSASMLNYAKKYHIQIVQHQDELPATGQAVVVEIQDLYSGGNAFIGHYKSATVAVQYLKDGQVVANTSKTRKSGGGLFGGFKGSCSVLGRTVNTIGADIDKWLSMQ